MDPRVHSFEEFYARLPPSPSTGLQYFCPGKDMLGSLVVLMSSLAGILEPLLETRHKTGERLGWRLWRRCSFAVLYYYE
ncbi:hypothetical protein NDU88_006243 [Pleurodeles waltl]|uniref:Uncharacterized protein n=1 Tax=Pleurodeles waltl TaxID=8319 RepID=A0AAV7SNZ3_PLEWA|nr:hypothetical protein NDU88_006243 [Pleurodeles waltl]